MELHLIAWLHSIKYIYILFRPPQDMHPPTTIIWGIYNKWDNCAHGYIIINRSLLGYMSNDSPVFCVGNAMGSNAETRELIKQTIYRNGHSRR
jgi:hypothetical protein